MASQVELDGVYLGNALNHARLSKAVRSKVGAILVTTHGVMLSGYNGTPSGTDNVCEDMIDGVLVSKPTVIHAELNCIMKAARQGVSVDGSTVYVTLAPCLQCAAMLKQVGVVRLVYLQEYRDISGIRYLRGNGIKVEKHE